MSADRPILLLTETGFVIRNLLLGSFAEQVARTHPLLVAVQNPDDPNLLSVVQGRNIRLIPFPFEPYRESRPFLKRFFSWDNWIYSIGYSKKPLSSRRTQARLFEGEQDWKLKMLYRIPISIGFILNFVGLNRTIEKKYVENYVLNKSITLTWKKILEELNPALVISSMLTHSVRFRCSTDLPVVAAANQLGIKTCTLVQSWDNLSSKTSVLPDWVDRYFTWSTTMTNELIQFNPGIARSHVAIVGSPQYDFHKDSTLLKSREEYCGSLNLNPARPYVLIGTGTAKWMPDEMQKMVQLVARIRREIPEMQVVIRLHPKDQGDRWKPHMKELQSKGVHIQYSSPDVHMDKGGFIPPRDFYREQVNVINHAAVVINSSSSLTVDAAIFDKPVICIGYDLAPDSLFPEGRSKAYSQSSHFGKLVKTGGVPVVRNEDECIEWIKIYLKDPSRLREERKKIVELVTDGIIGDSGMRMANEVMSMIQ